MTIDFQRLERNLARDFRQYHVTAQVYRVAGVFLGALSLQLADGWHDWTWKGVYALLAAAAYGALRQIAPQVPWKLVLQHMQWAQAAAEHQAAVDAAKPSEPPTSETTYTPVTAPIAPAVSKDAQPPGDVPPTTTP